MKRWLVLICLALFLTGCEKNPVQVESKGETAPSSAWMSESGKNGEELQVKLQTEDAGEELPAKSQTEGAGEELPAKSQTEDVAEEITQQDMEDLQQLEFFFPTSDVQEISDKDMEELSADALRLARNEIYARYGYIFNDAVLNAYFSNCSWYTPKVKSADFDESILSATERGNIQKLKEAEDAKRADAVPSRQKYAVIYEYVVYLDDGYLYYNVADGFCLDSNSHEYMDRYEGVNDIKRLRVLNVGTDVNPVVFLITNQGDVYEQVYYDGAKKAPVFEKFELLEGYAVEDILYFEGERQFKVEVLLKDGKTAYVESEAWD